MDYQQVKERVERESRALPKIVAKAGIEILILIIALIFLSRSWGRCKMEVLQRPLFQA